MTSAEHRVRRRRPRRPPWRTARPVPRDLVATIADLPGCGRGRGRPRPGVRSWVPTATWSAPAGRPGWASLPAGGHRQPRHPAARPRAEQRRRGRHRLRHRGQGDLDIDDRIRLLTPGPEIEATIVGVFRFGDTGNLGGATLDGVRPRTAPTTARFRRPTPRSRSTRPGRAWRSCATGSSRRSRTPTSRGPRASSCRRDFLRRQGGPELPQHLPADLRLHRRLRRVVHHPQHLHDAGCATHPGARAAAGARRQPPPGHPLGDGRGAGGRDRRLDAGPRARDRAPSAARWCCSEIGIELGDGLVLKASTVLIAYLVGVTVTMVAAYFPARRAAKDPAGGRDERPRRDAGAFAAPPRAGRRRRVRRRGAALAAGLAGAGAGSGWGSALSAS